MTDKKTTLQEINAICLKLVEAAAAMGFRGIKPNYGLKKITNGRVTMNLHEVIETLGYKDTHKALVDMIGVKGNKLHATVWKNEKDEVIVKTIRYASSAKESTLVTASDLKSELL